MSRTVPPKSIFARFMTMGGKAERKLEVTTHFRDNRLARIILKSSKIQRNEWCFVVVVVSKLKLCAKIKIVPVFW